MPETLPTVPVMPLTSDLAADPAAPRAIPVRAWLLLVFVAAAAVLFVIDRQVLSLLKTTLRTEVGLDDVHYGWLVTAFMVPYTVMYLFTGAWLDRWGTRAMSVVFIGAMSLATVATGLSSDFTGMAAGRVLLGVAEAGIIPASILFVVQWFPRHRRATALAIKSPIAVLGQVITPPLVAWLTLTWSWRATFFLPGLIGFGVAGAWWLLDRNPPDYGEPRVREARPGLLGLLRRRELWPLLASRLLSDPFWFFLLYWHAGFLQERLGLTLAQVGRWAWIPPLCSSLGTLAAGVLSDRLVARGFALRRARTLPIVGATVLAPLAILLALGGSPALAIGLLGGLFMMCGAWISLTNILVADLVPRNSVATAVGLLSALGGVTSALFNLLAGPLVAQAGYVPPLLAGALLHPLAAVVVWRAYARR